MPTKRCSCLARAARYFYDAEAVRTNSDGWHGKAMPTHAPEDAERQSRKPRRMSKMPDGWDTGIGGHGSVHRNGREHGEAQDIRAGANLRNVWTIPTQGVSAAHFATFAEKLVEPCILAGTSAEGACAKCGAPWVRDIKRKDVHPDDVFGVAKEADRSSSRC